MNNINEQNGRQLSTEQAAPLTDPRTRGLRAVPPTPESQRICRDFVWGICSMNDHCKYRHELEYDSMRSILKFCHDYQNRTGCMRPECTYLHASREEENLFLTSGVIPRVLVERYASMSAPSEPAPEPVPSMMYMNEYIAPPLPTILAPPPPPPPPTILAPPPPPPPSITSAPTQMAPPVYTAAQPLQHSVPTIYPVTPPLQQQPQTQSPQYGIPVMYDPSRPPPPILKRPAPPDPEGAGPSKLLKVDDDPTICDSCIEHNLRLALEQQEIEKLQREEEYRRRIYDQKSEKYEDGNVLLRSVLTPQIFRIVDEFLDVNASSSDIFRANSSPTYGGNSAMPGSKQLLFQLMELLISKRNSDQLASPIEIFTRRSTSQTELIFASIMELLQNGVSSESGITSALELIGGNGLGRLAGLSSAALELPSSSRYVPPARRYSAATVPYPPTNGEVVSPAAPAPAQPGTAPRPFYQPYAAATAPVPPPPAPVQPYQPQPQPHQPQPHQPQPHQPQPHQPQPHQPQTYHVPRMPHYYQPPFQ